MEQGNYSLDYLPSRAAASRTRLQDDFTSALDAYHARKAKRKANNTPVIAFLGHGRAGKDTAAEYFCATADLWYAGSSSRVVLPYIADSIGLDEERAWTERHQNRMFWLNWCHAFRGLDYSLLVRMALGIGDVAVGIRGVLELDAVVNNKIVDLTVWVENDRVPVDPTVEYSKDDCDVVLCNNGSRLEFYAKLRKFYATLSTRWFVKGD